MANGEVLDNETMTTLRGVFGRALAKAWQEGFDAGQRWYEVDITHYFTPDDYDEAERYLEGLKTNPYA